MLVKTQGIVFHCTKFSETSIIARIYTREFGLLSFIVNGVRLPGKRNKSAYFSPFSILELDIYKRENKHLLRIKDYKRGYVFKSLPFDLRKGATAMFLIEVMNKCIKEEERDTDLFDFMQEQIIALDKQEPDNVFHLKFLMELTRFLGFYPDGQYGETALHFDLLEGRFVHELPGHDQYLADDACKLFSAFLLKESKKYSSRERDALLGQMLRYYKTHLHGMDTLRSHIVLQEVLN